MVDTGTEVPIDICAKNQEKGPLPIYDNLQISESFPACMTRALWFIVLAWKRLRNFYSAVFGIRDRFLSFTSA